MILSTGSSRSYITQPGVMLNAYKDSISFKCIPFSELIKIKGRPFPEFKNRSKKFNSEIEASIYANKLSAKTGLGIIINYKHNQKNIVPHIRIFKETTIIANEVDFISHRIEETGITVVEPRLVGYDYEYSFKELCSSNKAICVVCRGSLKEGCIIIPGVKAIKNEDEDSELFIEAMCNKCKNKAKENKINKNSGKLSIESKRGYYDSIYSCSSKEDQLVKILNVFHDGFIIENKFEEV